MQKDKFDISYPIERNEDEYIVPLLLPNKTPIYSFEDGKNIQIRYVYDQFMPAGIISQFIVRSFELIAEDDNSNQLVWKSGVILKKENTIAEVIKHTNNKEIRIKLFGNNISSLRGIIMNYKSLVECVNDLEQAG